jgi:hypothetical protein
MRFFDDKSFGKKVALTEEEIKFLDLLEYKISKTSGYSKLSGGHCLITVVDLEDDILLHLRIQVGVEGEHLSDYGEAIYNRETRKIVEE